MSTAKRPMDAPFRTYSSQDVQVPTKDDSKTFLRDVLKMSIEVIPIDVPYRPYLNLDVPGPKRDVQGLFIAGRAIDIPFRSQLSPDVPGPKRYVHKTVLRDVPGTSITGRPF